MTRCCGVFPVMCPSGESGTGLAPAAGLIRSLSALLARDPSQFCRPRFHPQTDTGSCPQRLAGGRFSDARRSADYIVGVDRTATRTRSRSCTSSSGVLVAEATVLANSDGYAEAL